MKRWWTSLAARERSLIGLAVVIVGVLGLVQFIFVPLQAKQARARTAYAEARDVLAEVREGVASLEPAAADDNGRVTGASLRSALTVSAAQRGLSIVRVQPLDDGAISLRFEDADPAVLFGWLSMASEELGVRVRQATLRRNDGRAAVQATLVLQESGS